MGGEGRPGKSRERKRRMTTGSRWLEEVKGGVVPKNNRVFETTKERQPNKGGGEF